MAYEGDSDREGSPAFGCHRCARPPAHALREPTHDGQAEPGADRAQPPVALVENPRLEGDGEVVGNTCCSRRRPPAIIEPEPFDENGCRVICYPGDPRHSRRQPVWPGPTRLTHRNRRFEPEGGLAALLY